jgi:catechol 2,3-dioxygenase-like lactoylglutathione lyase family enzyme
MQPSGIHHVGLPVTDLEISVAWYREALGLTHEPDAGVPGGVAFIVAPTGERLELLAVDVQPSTWDGQVAALRAGVPHTAFVADPDGNLVEPLSRRGSSSDLSRSGGGDQVD